jgi:hypothetical protein
LSPFSFDIRPPGAEIIVMGWYDPSVAGTTEQGCTVSHIVNRPAPLVIGFIGDAAD